ncbi:hypothetical protein BGZ83_010155 [Gryganskiella cystojenkinii]|nr:hypothetical protein BGZ83_010155 [Gryganskiella cystojenkinii]
MGDRMGEPREQWFRALTDGFTESYNPDVGFVDFNADTPLGNLPDGITKDATGRFWFGTGSTREKVLGAYRGLVATESDKGFGPIKGAIIRDMTYKDANGELAARLGSGALDNMGTPIVDGSGERVSAPTKWSTYATTDPTWTESFNQIQSKSMTTSEERVKTMAGARINPGVRAAIKDSIHATIGRSFQHKVTSLDADALRDLALNTVIGDPPTGPQPDETPEQAQQREDNNRKAADKATTQRKSLMSHAKMSGAWTRFTAALWQAPTTTVRNSPTTFRCDGVTAKRSISGRPILAKRAAECMPSDSQVVNDDSDGEVDNGLMDRLAMQAHMARLIRAVTKNDKIFRNDHGSAPHQKTQRIQMRWILMLSTRGKDHQVHEQRCQQSIAAMKQRPDSKLVLGMFRDNKTQAESRENSVDTLGMKYLQAFGTSYENYKEPTKPGGYEPGDAVGFEDVLDQEGFVDDMFVIFYGDEYGDANDIGSIHEASVLDGVSEVAGGLVKPVSKLLDIEGGEEAEFDPAFAVEGTIEYATVYRVMGNVARARVFLSKMSVARTPSARAGTPFCVLEYSDVSRELGAVFAGRACVF